MDGRTYTGFYTAEPPNPARLVERTLDAAAEVGLSIDGSGSDPRDADVTFDDDRSTHLTIYWDQPHIPLSIPLKIAAAAVPQPCLRFACDSPQILSGEDTDEDAGFRPVYTDLLRELAIEIEPAYAFTRHEHFIANTEIPDAAPDNREFELERIPWLTILSESTLDRFGWTDRILDASAWSVERLDTGAVMLIKTENPGVDETLDHPVDRYLLDGDAP